MDIRKTAPEFLAGYANFYLDFSRRPIETIKSTTMSRDGAEGQVNAKLFWFCLLSVSISFVIVRIGTAIGMAEDTSWWPRFAAQVGEEYLPLVTLVMIFALGTISHILLKAGAVLTSVLGSGRFSESADVEAVLKCADVKSAVSRFGYVQQIKVLRREYMMPVGTFHNGYKVEVILSDGPKDQGSGYRTVRKIWRAGVDIH